MSADGDIAREAILRDKVKWSAKRSLAALARLEALAASREEREKWFAHAIESWKQEEADWIEQRDALVEALREIATMIGVEPNDSYAIARAALAETGLE